MRTCNISIIPKVPECQSMVILCTLFHSPPHQYLETTDTISVPNSFTFYRMLYKWILVVYRLLNWILFSFKIMLSSFINATAFVSSYLFLLAEIYTIIQLYHNLSNHQVVNILITSHFCQLWIKLLKSFISTFFFVEETLQS